jgi:paraquat-inducible protein B
MTKTRGLDTKVYVATDAPPGAIAGAEVRKALASLDQTLKASCGLVKRVDADLVPELRRTLEDARRAITSAGGVLATESPLQADGRRIATGIRHTVPTP